MLMTAKRDCLFHEEICQEMQYLFHEFYLPCAIPVTIPVTSLFQEAIYSLIFHSFKSGCQAGDICHCNISKTENVSSECRGLITNEQYSRQCNQLDMIKHVCRLSNLGQYENQ